MCKQVEVLNQKFDRIAAAIRLFQGSLLLEYLQMSPNPPPCTFFGGLIKPTNINLLFFLQEFNPEALLANFHLPNQNEIIIALYKLTDITLNNRPSSSAESTEKSETLFTLPKTVQDLHIRNPKVDTCIIVTNQGVYKVALK